MFERVLTKTQGKMATWTSIIAVFGAVWIDLSQSSLLNQSHQRQCRCFPGDTCWPSSAEWDIFNKILRGNLIATVPIASPCHNTFPGANWARPELHLATSHSPMDLVFANMSCDPFTPPDTQCVIGAYVSYAFNASGAEDYRATMAFAHKLDIRLVIRNMGHDYMGKLAGAGALALWTHHLKYMAILDYSSLVYTGKAMRNGAGDCPTVGITGGFTQGGGIGPLGSTFGLAADQVLDWEVVTANGELLTVTPSQNSDLYWAITGGGGGTYAAVLSMMIVKLHLDMPTAGVTLSFTELSSETYWSIVKTFLKNLPSVLDEGATSYWQVLPGNTFNMPQSYLLNKTAKTLEQLLQPTLKALEQSGIQSAFSSRNYLSFQDAFYTMNPEMNIVEINLGGRLIPHSIVESDVSAAGLISSIRTIIDSGGVLAGVSMNTSQPPTFANSIPYDRTNMTANIIGQRTVTDVLTAALEAASPGGAAYLNEADINQPHWQETL
ncbi:FAD binding domain protein [Biscogniauxia marginata]|nr:FAD binding domain protein [Biscogniauxia marginata]